MEVNSLDDVEEFLEHYGVKGMKWGEHRARHQARSDAVEFTKAKLAYGQGAGNRRKLIGAKVAARSSNPHYKKAFEEHLANQNLAKRARQAKTSHNVRATGRTTAKTARGVHRSLTGGFGSVTLSAAAIAGAIVLGRKYGADKVFIEKANQFARDRGSQAATKAWLRSQGVPV
jgi:hypothetical protein